MHDIIWWVIVVMAAGLVIGNLVIGILAWNLENWGERIKGITCIIAMCLLITFLLIVK